MSLQFTSNADQVDPVLMPSNPYALALNPLVRAIDKRHAESWCLLNDETEKGSRVSGIESVNMESHME